MTGCALPPELADLELHQFVEGDAEPAVVAHLQTCQYCRDRALQLRRMQSRLKHGLFRVDCPPPELLSAFKLHLLDKAGSTVIEAHLALCPHCAAEMADLTALSPEAIHAQDNLPSQLHNRIRVTMARWIKSFGGGAPMLGLQPAALRGNADAPFVFEDEEGNEISIALAARQAGQTNHRLTGLVVRNEGEQAASAGTVFVLQAGRSFGSTPIDALGNFDMELPASGDYDLIASLGDVEVHLPTIHIGAR
jgi:anti-sigma factor RsiW